jgi:hypothetical protein
MIKYATALRLGTAQNRINLAALHILEHINPNGRYELDMNTRVALN